MTGPLILKPPDGVGSEGVSLVRCEREFFLALDVMGKGRTHERILLQEFVPGQHASVSVLSSPGRCLPLSLNLQLIKTGIPFHYGGSQVPFHHAAAGQAIDLACAAVLEVPGMRGYVGIDLILSESSAQLIEINPRLTTSYLGLRQVSDVNLARAIYECCLFDIFPDAMRLNGQVIVRTNDFRTWGLSV